LLYVSADRTIDEKTAYLFFFNQFGAGGAKNRDADGFMPRGQQFGYMFTKGFPNKTVMYTAAAHELGHGVFVLKHTFDNDYQIPAGSTDNLMDYADNATHIAKWQWDLMHDPGVVMRVFERDKDTEIYCPAPRPKEIPKELVEGLKQTTTGYTTVPRGMSMLPCTKDWYYHIGNGDNHAKAGWYLMNEYKDLEIITTIRKIYVKAQLGEKLNDSENEILDEFFTRTIDPNFYLIIFGELSTIQMFPAEIAAALSGSSVRTKVDWAKFGENIQFNRDMTSFPWDEETEKFLQFFESFDYNKTNYQGVGLNDCFLANSGITWDNVTNLILTDYISGIGPEYFMFDHNHLVTKKIIGVSKVKEAIDEIKRIIRKDLTEGFSIPVGYYEKGNFVKKIINDTKMYVYRHNAKGDFTNIFREAVSVLGLKTSFDALLGSFSIMGILNEQTNEIEIILFNTTNSYSGNIFPTKLQPAIRGQASIPVPFSTIGQKLYFGKFKLQ
jgi:hypothetical protein